MDYVSELRKFVGHQPLILPGAVVLLLNEKREILLQHRHDGGWGLPGGIMELGESLEETARREVHEETGLSIGKLTLLGVFSGKEYYIKVANGDELYAVTAVYVTEEIKGQLCIDYSESKELSYFPLSQLPEGLTPIYRSYIVPFINRLTD